MTHPILLYPVDEVLLVRILPVVYYEGLEPSCGLHFDLPTPRYAQHNLSMSNYSCITTLGSGLK